MARATQAKTKKGAAEALRERLLSRRQEILDLYVNDLREGQRLHDDGADDLVDRANDAYAREFMLSLSGTERDTLLEIDGALKRLDDGEYGVCAHCEKTISDERLQAVPWAQYCVGCQELSEQGELYES